MTEKNDTARCHRRYDRRIVAEIRRCSSKAPDFSRSLQPEAPGWPVIFYFHINRIFSSLLSAVIHPFKADGQVLTHHVNPTGPSEPFCHLRWFALGLVVRVNESATGFRRSGTLPVRGTNLTAREKRRERKRGRGRREKGGEVSACLTHC